MVKIVLTKRAHDIHACIEGEPGKWAAGKTSNEAIGDLIRSHSVSFNIEFAWSSDLKTQRYISGNPLIGLTRSEPKA